MDKVLRPVRLEVSPESLQATRQYKHWLQTFEIFVANLKLPDSYTGRVTDAFTTAMATDKFHLDALTNFVSPDIWEDIKDAVTFTEAKNILDNLFIKQPSEPYARYKLQCAVQEEGQSLEGFRRTLEKLSRDCNFMDVTSSKYRLIMMLQAFLSGVRARDIRERLLGENIFSFDEAIKIAVARQDSNKEAGLYERAVNTPHLSAMVSVTPPNVQGENDHQESVSAIRSFPAVKGCPDCGAPKSHPRSQCVPRRRGDRCGKCHQKGHWAKMCRGRSTSSSHQASAVLGSTNQDYAERTPVTEHVSELCATTNSNKSPSCLSHAIIPQWTK